MIWQSIPKKTVMSGISPRAERVLFDSEFDPSCLDAFIIKECRKLKDIKLKGILSELQWKLLFSLDGESKSSSFDTTLMITWIILLRNLPSINVNPNDALPRDDDDSKSSDLTRLGYYRNLLSHFKDRNMDSSFFIKEWSDIVGAVGRLGGQRSVAEFQEYRPMEKSSFTSNLRQKAKTSVKDHLIQRSEEWKVNEYKVDTALKHVLKEAPKCLYLVGNCGTGKTFIAMYLALHFANTGYDIIPVPNPHKISSLIQTGGFCTRKLFVFGDISQQMDIVRYESITKGCSPSKKVLINCGDFFRNCFLQKKFENRRNVMLNIKTVKKKGGNFAHLDHRKAEKIALMKMYKHNEIENKHLSVLTFTTIYRQRNVDEYSIESTDRTKEICMITLMHKLDLHGCSKPSPFEKISSLLELSNADTKANSVENRCDKHVLHNEGKNIEVTICYNNTDTPWKEKHVLLERIAKIEKYCDQMFAFVARSLQYSEDQTLWLEMQTEDLLNTAYKRLFQLLGTSDGNEDSGGEHMNDEEICGVLVKICDGALEKQNQISKQQLIECQMCIDQNNALYWCTNCRMNICSFCKMYHETVWTVMNHEVYPLHLLS